MPYPALNNDFFKEAHGMCQILSRNLPFEMEGEVFERGYAHDVLNAYWVLDAGEGYQKTIGAHVILAFVNEEGREHGHRSGIVRVQIYGDLQGQGLAKILVRNAMELFKVHGDKMVDVNGIGEGGSYIAQSIGFTPSMETRDLNPDDDMHEWTTCLLFDGHAEQVKKIQFRLEHFHEKGFIDTELYERARGTLDKDDPKSIWDFMDIKDVVTEEVRIYDLVKTGTLPSLVMNGIDVAMEFDMQSNSQWGRLSEKTESLHIDETKLNEAVESLVAEWRNREDIRRANDEWDRKHPNLYFAA